MCPIVIVNVLLIMLLMNISPHTWPEMHYTYVGKFCQSSYAVLVLLCGFKGIHVSNETKNKETTNKKNLSLTDTGIFGGAIPILGTSSDNNIFDYTLICTE